MVGEADRSPGLRGRPDGLACAFCIHFAGADRQVDKRFRDLGSGPSWLGRVRVEPAHRDQAQPKVPDLRQDPVQRGLIGQPSRDDRLRAIIADLEAGEPVRPPVIEDAFDAELVAGRPPEAAHTRSPSAQAAGTGAGLSRCW